MRTETDRILLEAAAAASLDDLATIAGCAIERWRQQRPDPDEPDDGFDDRFVQLGTTFGGAAVIRKDRARGRRDQQAAVPRRPAARLHPAAPRLPASPTARRVR
jgi:hypothetical protein